MITRPIHESRAGTLDIGAHVDRCDKRWDERSATDNPKHVLKLLRASRVRHVAQRSEAFTERRSRSEVPFDDGVRTLFEAHVLAREPKLALAFRVSGAMECTASRLSSATARRRSLSSSLSRASIEPFFSK